MWFFLGKQVYFFKLRDIMRYVKMFIDMNIKIYVLFDREIINIKKILMLYV